MERHPKKNNRIEEAPVQLPLEMPERVEKVESGEIIEKTPLWLIRGRRQTGLSRIEASLPRGDRD